MEKELFNEVLSVLNKNLYLTQKKLCEEYESFYELLNEIIDNYSYNFKGGRLVAFPMGDYITNTCAENSQIEFLIIYQTQRECVDFAIVSQKTTYRGKKKLSTLQSLVGRPTEKGNIQAEDVAEIIAYALKENLKASQFVFQKRNEIVVSLSTICSVKINIVYDLNEKDLLQRHINRWQSINPIKYINNIEEKDKKTNGNYRFIVKFLKSMELEMILSKQSNLLIGKNGFIENLVYNVPDELFCNDEKNKILDKIIIYLKNAKISNFNLIDETGMMFKKKYRINYANQFINKIYYANENFDKILELSYEVNKNDDE